MRLRKSARSLAEAPETSLPSSQYWPEVGWSRQPMMFIRVLLPEPLTPMSATSSPRSMDSEIPFNTGTSISPQVVGLVQVIQFYQFHNNAPTIIGYRAADAGYRNGEETRSSVSGPRCPASIVSASAA